MKVSILYYSRTGNTRTMAHYIAEGIERVEGMKAGVFSIDDIDEDFALESDGFIFGTPTYVGGPAAEMYSFLVNEVVRYRIAGKLAGVFATEQYVHGGADVAMLRMAESLMVYGMMLYSGGGSYGRPVIHFGPVEVSPDTEKYRELFVTYGERFARQIKIISTHGK